MLKVYGNCWGGLLYAMPLHKGWHFFAAFDVVAHSAGVYKVGHKKCMRGSYHDSVLDAGASLLEPLLFSSSLHHAEE